MNQHVSVTKKTLSLFGYPYFKDVQMYHPPPNADTLRKPLNLVFLFIPIRGVYREGGRGTELVKTIMSRGFQGPMGAEPPPSPFLVRKQNPIFLY